MTPVVQLLNDKPAKSEATLKRNFLGPTVETSVNAYVVNTGGKLVLINTGAANCSVRPWATCSSTSLRRAIGPNKWTRSTSRTCTPITSVA